MSRNQRGFTLTETMLVLVVGAVLLGSGLMLYSQIRQNSAHSAAMERVQGLQMVVEELTVAKESTNPIDMYPTLDELRSVWQSKRPNDFARSPWGGISIAADGSDATVHRGIRGGDRPPGDYRADIWQNTGDIGILYYYRMTAPAFGWLVHRDLSKGGFDDQNPVLTRTRFYMVAMTDDLGNRYWYVNGPQKNDPTEQGGQVGN